MSFGNLTMTLTELSSRPPSQLGIPRSRCSSGPAVQLSCISHSQQRYSRRISFHFRKGEACDSYFHWALEFYVGCAAVGDIHCSGECQRSCKMSEVCNKTGRKAEIPREILWNMRPMNGDSTNLVREEARRWRLWFLFLSTCTQPAAREQRSLWMRSPWVSLVRIELNRGRQRRDQRRTPEQSCCAPSSGSRKSVNGHSAPLWVWGRACSSKWADPAEKIRPSYLTRQSWFQNRTCVQ